jgi:CHAD domain-containing protein
MIIDKTVPVEEPQMESLEPKEPQTLAQIIAGQFDLLRSYFQDVLATQEVEAIHKMRVTTRRLQASLDLLQIGKDEFGIRKLKRKLRRLRRKLSEVRNYDVFLILLDQEAGKRRTVKPPFAHLKEELMKSRALRAEKVRVYLGKIDLGRIYRKLNLESASDQPGSKAQPPLADEKAIGRRAAERIEQRFAEFQSLAASVKPTTHPEEFHQLRIAAKRLRYLLEIATEMGFKGNLTALGYLRSLQDRIGDWHDFEALEDEIISIIANPDFVKHYLRESHLILAAAVHLRKRKQALVKRLLPVHIHPSVSNAAGRVAKAYRRKYKLDREL